MNKNLQNCRQLQETVLILISLSPVISVLYGLFYENDVWLTMISFHLCLTFFPLMFKLYFPNATSFNYFKGECKGFRDQLINGAQLGMIIFIALSAFLSLFVLYFNYLFRIITGLQQNSCSEFAVSCDTPVSPALFGLYFSVVNPIIEESYWNVFLVKSLPNAGSRKGLVCVLYAFYHFVREI